MLDAHLRAHYGEAFEASARKPAKLIPFLYGSARDDRKMENGRR